MRTITIIKTFAVSALMILCLDLSAGAQTSNQARRSVQNVQQQRIKTQTDKTQNDKAGATDAQKAVINAAVNNALNNAKKQAAEQVSAAGAASKDLKTYLESSDYRSKENQSALDSLAAIGNRYPESEVMPEARYTQAKALCNLARFEEAVTLIDNSTTKFPESAFTTRALILKGDAIFSLYGTAKSVYSITNALSAYDIAGGRADATAETRLECYYKKGRCLEKGGDAENVAKYYYDNVIGPFYNLGENDMTPQCVAFFEKAVFACARLHEQAGAPGSALDILRRLVEYGTPERAQAEREISRIQNGKE